MFGDHQPRLEDSFYEQVYLQTEGLGVLYQWDGSNSELRDYRMLQYNYLFDKDTVTWGY